MGLPVRSTTGICATVGATLGGFLPGLWGAGQLSLASIAFGAAGGVAGAWLGRRLLDA